MKSDDGDDGSRLRVKQGRLILTHGLMAMATIVITTNAETVLFQQLVGGDVVKADRLLAMTLSAAAAIEFSLAPTLGRLTDALGR